MRMTFAAIILSGSSAHRNVGGAHDAAAAAQAHVETEALRIGARIDDRNRCCGLLRGAEQAVRRSTGIQILGRLELALAYAFAPAVFEQIGRASCRERG